MEKSPARFVAESVVSGLLPVEPNRHVFSLLREIYIDIHEEFFGIVTDQITVSDRTAKLKSLRKLMREVGSWLTPPVPPLSAELAIDAASKTDSPVIRDLILKQVGKRMQRGQPVSEKRFRAVLALDGKYAFPGDITLRGATNALCPCGLGSEQQHTKQCQEQFRQQINRAVKLLKSFGYDFTWDRIGKPGWKEKIE